MEKIEKNYIISYPRSGNHLIRFFVELLSELPTHGCIGNKKDVPIYTNIFKNDIPFNIKNSDEYIYFKSHFTKNHFKIKDLIFIVRNPLECISKHSNYDKKRIINDLLYFNLIEQYECHKGKKILFFYEDILNNKEKFINDLYNFLEINNKNKLDYVLNNLEELWHNSLNPISNRKSWAGNNSKQQVDFHFKKLKEEDKNIIKNNIFEKLKKYPLFFEYYTLMS